jgi:uncharacterized membrane protein
MAKEVWRRLRFNLLWSILTPQDREYVTKLLMNSRNWQTEMPVREILTRLQDLDDYFNKIVLVVSFGIVLPMVIMLVMARHYVFPDSILLVLGVAWLLGILILMAAVWNLVWIMRKEQKYRLLYAIAQRQD